MLIHALDKEQSSRANNGSGARKSALQSSTPWKACQAGRLGLLRGGARAEGRALLQLTSWSWQLATRLGKTLVPRKRELRVEVRGRGRGVAAVYFSCLKKKKKPKPKQKKPNPQKTPLNRLGFVADIFFFVPKLKFKWCVFLNSNHFF